MPSRPGKGNTTKESTAIVLKEKKLSVVRERNALNSISLRQAYFANVEEIEC